MKMTMNKKKRKKKIHSRLDLLNYLIKLAKEKIKNKN